MIWPMRHSPPLRVLATSVLFLIFDLTNGLAGTINWHVAGPMQAARENHVAILLGDGRVLVVGGKGNGGINPEFAELYDPVNRQWSRTESSGYSLELGHTATLLKDGRVLVAGGLVSTTKAMLFDPVSGTWTPTGDLKQGRYGHRATLLADGEVLVVGGIGQTGITASAELYDPATGKWRFTGSLNEARSWHQAVLLKDGRVLVTGGEDHNAVALSSAEIYDPATELWTTTGNMRAGRIAFTLSLLNNGKALAVGGFNDCQPCNFLKRTELYDPSRGTWAPSGKLTVGRSNHAVATLSDGRLAVSGGFDGETYEATATVEVYDPNQQAWTAAGPMRTKRLAHTMTSLQDGRLLVSGGDDSYNNAYQTAEVGTIAP
jgi:N-acetylneuraminic acid mutarotase